MAYQSPAEKRFVRTLMNEDNISPERERELIKTVQNGSGAKRDRALHELMTSHGKKVIAIVRTIRYEGIDPEDLRSAGMLGLAEAIIRFNEGFDNRLATYAERWIRSAIQEYIHINWRPIRMPSTAPVRKMVGMISRLRREAESRAVAEGAEISQFEINRRIAERLDLSESRVAVLIETLGASGCMSMNAVTSDDGSGGGGASLQDTLSDEQPTPEQAVLERLDNGKLSGRLRGLVDTILDDRERRIIASRWLTQEDPMKLAVLAEIYDVSMERISQIETRALGKLRRALADEGLGEMKPGKQAGRQDVPLLRARAGARVATKRGPRTKAATAMEANSAGCGAGDAARAGRPALSLVEMLEIPILTIAVSTTAAIKDPEGERLAAD